MKSKYRSVKNSENIKRIKWAIHDKVCHFAPTISPAPKNMEKREIESIEEALKYYRDNGINKIIIQPKYMGSYVDILLTKNIEETVIFSRNAYKVRHLDREKLIAALRPLHERLAWLNIDAYLIQAELLPWSAFGKGLIEREFYGYYEANKIHLDYLAESGIFNDIENFKNMPEFLQYKEDKKALSKDELNIKYPHYLKKQYEAIWDSETFNATSLQETLKTFKEQVDLYAYETDSYELKPFNLLKIFSSNGTQWINDSHILGFGTVSEDASLILDLEEKNNSFSFDEGVKIAYEFYNRLVDNHKMEGIMIKPDKIYQEGIVPMFKVRNMKYLVMIYGVDFERKFDYYLNKRNINKKMRVSMNEWKISQALLKIRKGDITHENEEYVKLIEARINEEKFEETLDSRL